jgi:predicted transcriptional regulator
METTAQPRTLTITLQPDWQAALRSSAQAAFRADAYRGESLNFESAAAIFAHLTERRWALIHVLQGAGEVPVRELARRVGRDVKRVHEDAASLVDLGLIERTERGGLRCPFADIHVDLHLRQAA